MSNNTTKKHTITVNNPEAWEGKRTLTVEINFDGVEQSQLIEWALSNRVIALQRVLREMTEEGIDELVRDGLTVHAMDCGKKIRTAAEILAEAKARFASLPADVRAVLLKDLEGLAEGNAK